ncbi:hypothetical protein ES703_102639 [subsurface metagenome]
MSGAGIGTGVGGIGLAQPPNTTAIETHANT